MKYMLAPIVVVFFCMVSQCWSAVVTHTLDGDVASTAGVQSEQYTAANDTGTANAYAITVTPAPTVAPYSWFSFKAANANTGSSTLTVNGGTPTAIYKWGGATALTGGEIAAGQIVRVIYDGTNFQMQSQLANTNTMSTKNASYYPYTLISKYTPIVSIIEPNAAITWTLAANPGNGYTRITSSGAHGLTTSPAVGHSIYISAWSGTGVAGFYNIAAVPDTTHLDLTLTYNAGLGNPTVALANTEVTLATYTLQGGTLLLNGQLWVIPSLSITNSTNSKTINIKLNTAALAYTTSTSGNITANPLARFINRGSQSSQLYGMSGTSGIFSFSGTAWGTSSIDTSANQTVYITAQPGVVNEYIQLEGYTILAWPYP